MFDVQVVVYVLVVSITTRMMYLCVVCNHVLSIVACVCKGAKVPLLCVS